MSSSFWELLDSNKVVIPIIQRDYAQGRLTSNVKKIREGLLKAIFNSLNNQDQQLELDFIYGYIENIENNVIFYPLDGQQRLTTLFLLHWYIATREGQIKNVREKLMKFTYETRHSSRVFCSELVRSNDIFPIPEGFTVKSAIINQPWFFTAWENDPTITSMLTMLEAIEQKVEEYNIDNIWSLLTGDNPSIVFHILSMKDLGLPDDLYIKMNSRGKQLTEFEYFKIRFSELIDKNFVEEFKHKMDLDWSDLFWNLYKDNDDEDIAKLVDDGFLRFFKYMTDILIARENLDVENYSDEYDRYVHVYSNHENISFLFKILDKFHEIYRQHKKFFSNIFYVNDVESNKENIRLFFISPEVDLMKKCSSNYDTGQRNNPFSLGEQLLLYASIIHILNDTEFFNTRIRILRNLIINSSDTVRKENITSLIITVEELILSGLMTSENKFSSSQLEEEAQKEKFLSQNPDMQKIVCDLENHEILQGCISIFELDRSIINVGQTFINIFSSESNLDDESCAMMTQLFYGQWEQRYTRFMNTNNSTWRELLSPSAKRKNYENTKVSLKMLLQTINSKNVSIGQIIADYLNTFKQNPDQEKEFSYYFVKYKKFREFREGYYIWPDPEKKYECLMLNRKQTNGSRWDPYLYSIFDECKDLVTLGNDDRPLVFSKNSITLEISNFNDGFKFVVTDDKSKRFINSLSSNGLVSVNYELRVAKSDKGFDIEDRVDKGVKLIKELNILAAKFN